MPSWWKRIGGVLCYWCLFNGREMDSRSMYVQTNAVVSMRHYVLWDMHGNQAYQWVYVSRVADVVGAMKQKRLVVMEARRGDAMSVVV